MPTKPKSANGTSKLTVAEKASWYDENFASIQNFELAKSAAKQLRKITKTYTNPTSIFDKEKLRSFLKNIAANQKNLRSLSWFLYYRSQIYARLVNFYANMFVLDARMVVPKYDLVKPPKGKEMLQSYNDTLDNLDRMRVQDEMYVPLLTCFIQDVFYGVVIYDDTGIFIFPWPADYAKITGKYMTGDFSYAVDVSYLNKFQELLEFMPEPFQSLWNEYQNTGQRWQPMHDEYAMCYKFRSEDIDTIVSPLVAILNSLINLIDLEDVQAIADAQSIYKMLWIELETLQGAKDINDWKINPEVVTDYFDKMVADALPDYISAAIVPGKLNEISFPDDQTADTSKIAKATEAVLNTAGGAEILNGSTINNTYAFKLACIANTEYAISSLLPQIQAWVNRFLGYQVKNPCSVKYFPISVYTKADFKEQLLSAAQNGMPTKLAYNTLNHFSEKDTIALNVLEEEILGLSDKLIPLSTSYTRSKDDVDPGETGETGQGRPELDVGDLSDSGDRSRAKSGG